MGLLLDLESRYTPLPSTPVRRNCSSIDAGSVTNHRWLGSRGGGLLECMWMFLTPPPVHQQHHTTSCMQPKNSSIELPDMHDI